MNIYVYDTKTLNIDEGALAFEADLMMQEGKSMLDIVNRLDELRKNSLFMFTLSELYHPQQKTLRSCWLYRQSI